MFAAVSLVLIKGDFLRRAAQVQSPFKKVIAKGIWQLNLGLQLIVLI